jgi:plasmid stability protein
MQQITIRGLDCEVEKKIRDIASSSKKSINQVIKDIIHKNFNKKESPAASLKQLAGGWNQKDAADFRAAIQPCEQIDDEMWQ